MTSALVFAIPKFILKTRHIKNCILIGKVRLFIASIFENPCVFFMDHLFISHLIDSLYNVLNIVALNFLL